MSAIDSSKSLGAALPPAGARVTRTERGGFRLRRMMVVVVFALSTFLVGCTPAEIEQSMAQLSVSFEQGGVEGGLISAAFIAQQAVPIIGMRLGSLAP
jgi:hypothetical protein